MEHTQEKNNAYKEGWNANCKGELHTSGDRYYALGTPERASWESGFEDAQKVWDEGKEPRFMNIKYSNPLGEGWKKLSYQ